MALPFPGGRVRVSGNVRAWRRAACGRVSPWSDTHGGWWSLRQEDDGLYADRGRGYPVWCSLACQEKLGALGEFQEPQAPKAVRRPTHR